MADDKKIPIHITTTADTKGAGEAKKSIDEAAKSAKGFDGQLGSSGSGGVREWDQATKEAARSTKELGKAAEEAAPKVDELNDKTDEGGKKVEEFGRKTNIAGAASAGLALGGAILSKQIGEIREAIESLDIEKLRQIAPEMAAQAERMQEISEWFADPISAIQRALSGTTVSEAFAEVNEALAAAAEQHESQINRIIENGRKTRDELKALADEIRRANEVLDAKDKADSAERDRADAKAIEEGADPFAVREQRAKDDAEKEIARINRGLSPQVKQTNAAFSDAAQARANLQNVERDPKATRENIQKAKQEVAAAEAEAERLKKDLDQAKAVAEQQRRGVRARAAAEVDEVGRDRAADTDRRAQEAVKEQQRRQREDEADRRRAEAEAERGRRVGPSAGVGPDPVSGGSGFADAGYSGGGANFVSDDVSRRNRGLRDQAESQAARAARRSDADKERGPGFGSLTDRLALEDENRRKRKEDELRGRRGPGADAGLRSRAEALMSDSSQSGGGDVVGLLERLVSFVESQGGGGKSSAVGGDALRSLEQRIRNIEARERVGRDGR